MELAVLKDQQDKKSETIVLDDEKFNRPYNGPLIHQMVTAYLAAARSGTKAQKNRAMVRGGSRKPRPQKGTGRSRAGTIRSPIWRGGGVTFPAKTKSYQQKVNKKMYQAAFSSILSEMIRKERLLIVATMEMQKPSTKELAKRLQSLQISHALIVVAETDESLLLSARNIPNLDVIGVRQLNPYSLLRYQHTVFTKEAIAMVEGRI